MGSPPLLVELSPRRWMLDGLATTVGGALTPAVDVRWAATVGGALTPAVDVRWARHHCWWSSHPGGGC